MKRLLALACLLALTVVPIATASAEEDRLGGLTLPLVDEPTTVTVLFSSNYEMTEDTWLFQQIKERTGIQIQPLCYTLDIAKEKFSTYLAGANLPDICVTGLMSAEEFNIYGEQGAFVSPDDYLNIMPNFKRIFFGDEENKALYKQYATSSGRNYTMPVYRLNRDVNFGFMYRADVLEQLGIEPWTDTESFYQALSAMKRAYPDSYPYASKGGPGMLLRWATYWDINNLPEAYDYETGKWYIGCTDERFKEMLDFCKKLYNEGLLDPEFLTDNLDSWTAKFLNDKAFVMNDWIGRMALLNAQAAESIPGFDLVYGRPIGNGKMQELAKFNAWGVSVANNQNTEAALKLVDYLYSPEGSELMTVGAEGVNFNWDEDGKPVYFEMEDAAPDIVKLEEKYGMWIEGLYLHPDRRSCYFNLTDHEQAAQDLINNECGYTKLPPYVSMNDEDAEAFNQLKVELQAKMETFEGNYIMNAEYGDAQWGAWVESAMAAYGDEMLALLNQ